MTITDHGVISPETPAETYSWGRMAYDRARSPRWAASIRDYTGRQADALLEALEIYEAIDSGTVHPSAWFEEEIRDEAEPVHAALVLVAEAIAERVADLAAVFPGCAVVAEGEAAA